MLGDNAQEDREARLFIIQMYDEVQRILSSEPRDGTDPRFVGDWIHGYLMAHVEDVEREQAAVAVRKALSAVELGGRRGIPSKARHIVRELLATVGYSIPVQRPKGETWIRRTIQVADQHLRRVIDRGDPMLLRKEEADRARAEAAKHGIYARPAGRLLARSPDTHEWRLYLVRRHRKDSMEPRSTAEVLLEKGETRRLRDAQSLAPDDMTPVGRARDVVREWARDRHRTEQERELARLFLKRRR